MSNFPGKTEGDPNTINYVQLYFISHRGWNFYNFFYQSLSLSLSSH